MLAAEKPRPWHALSNPENKSITLSDSPSNGVIITCRRSRFLMLATDSKVAGGPSKGYREVGCWFRLGSDILHKCFNRVNTSHLLQSLSDSYLHFWTLHSDCLGVSWWRIDGRTLLEIIWMSRLLLKLHDLKTQWYSSIWHYQLIKYANCNLHIPEQFDRTRRSNRI